MMSGFFMIRFSLCLRDTGRPGCWVSDNRTSWFREMTSFFVF